MGVTEEIYRLAYQATGLAGMKQAQAEMEKIGRMGATAKRHLDAGRISAEEYGQAMEILAKKTARAQEAMDRLHRSNRGGIGGGGSERGAALGRTGFALANIAQDIGQAGPSAALNNVLNPMVWDDLATAVGGSRAALIGFGAAGVAALAGLAVAAKDLNDELSKGGLALGDFGAVLGNLPAVESATGKFGDLADAIGTMIPEAVKTAGAAIGDFLATSPAMTALNVMGLQEAIEKTRKEKDDEGLHRARTIQLGRMAVESGAIVNPAKWAAQGVGIDEVVAQVKGENDLAARQQAEAEAEQKAKQDRDSRRRHEVDAAMRNAKAQAIEGVPFAEQNVRTGLEWRMGDGMGADQASAEVADWLTKMIGDALPEADAKAAAEEFVGKELKGMRDAAANELASDPAAMTMRALDLMGMGGGMGGGMAAFAQGPQTMSAGSFAQNVQDSQKPLIDLQREQIDLQRQQIEYLQKVADNTRMNTLVGP